ncbi:MAG TPA: hypothetical protein VKD22_03555 [Ramlibacter sp.]|nr:hypothetical protein [Ramlibacter sp.]
MAWQDVVHSGFMLVGLFLVALFVCAFVLGMAVHASFSQPTRAEIAHVGTVVVLLAASWTTCVAVAAFELGRHYAARTTGRCDVYV